MRPASKRLIITLISIVWFLTTPYSPAFAQAGSALDLINGVNNLRQTNGLVPYSVDSFLMGFAQSHSDYMASLGTWTHTRADGSTAFDYGIKENVAMGTNMSIDYCIYTTWADWVHWNTMLGFTTGKVGAGVTVADGMVYYVLNVTPGESANPANDDPGEALAEVVPAQLAQDTPIPLAQVIANSPDADGIIVHRVRYGETLWTIAEAYGITIDIILQNSGLAPTTTEVYEGQLLLIQPATEITPSITPSLTPTVIPDTPTPTKPRPTMTPFPTRTPMPTFTPTPAPSIIHEAFGDAKTVGIGLIAVCGVGLILVIYLGFIKKN